MSYPWECLRPGWRWGSEKPGLLSLPTAWELELDKLQGAFQPKQFCDSAIL